MSNQLNQITNQMNTTPRRGNQDFTESLPIIIPDSYKCPITKKIMIDPVIDPATGITFERNAIEALIKSRNLSTNSLRPNRALKEIIDQFKKDNIIDDTISQIVETPLQITSNLELFINKDTEYKLIKIKSPNANQENNQVYVLTLDNSGSMNMYAKEGIESDQMTRLDVLKHGIKVLISSANENHYIGLVTFESYAQIESPIIQMTEVGKQTLLTILDRIESQCSTNLYDGILKSFDLIKNSEYNNLNSSIILFTDGEPASECTPPRGYIQALKNWKDINNGKYPAPINIFTLGNNVDSELSNSISEETGGIYGFMPDASFIGDLLLHHFANERTVRYKNTILKIQGNINLETGSNNNETGYINYEKQSWGIIIKVGDILYGQDRNFVIKGDIENCELIYDNLCLSSLPNGNIYNQVKFNLVRQLAVNCINNILHLLNLDYKYKLREAVDVYNQFIRIVDLNQDAINVSEIKKDFEKEIKMAFSSEEIFNKWGKHYLLSIKRAYELQRCNNYKDFGVQMYGGPLYNKILLELDQKFISIPPPQRKTTSYEIRHGITPVSRVINMSQSYDSRNTVCFHGESKITLYNGESKLVSELKKDDSVLLANGKISKIECMVETKLNLAHTANLIRINPSLCISFYHPIKINGDWVFPKNVVINSSETYCYGSIYSIVLEKDLDSTSEIKTRGYGAGVLFDNIEVATLGHNITTDDVITHDFFGTEKVIDNLKESPDYENGLVVIKSVTRQDNRTIKLIV